MKFRTHGANPDKLYKLWNIEKPDEIYDFSSNVNVISPKFNCDISEINLSQYPDDECSELKALLSEITGRKESELLTSNGTNEAIFLLAANFSYKNHAIIQPTYGQYEKALSAYNCKYRYISSFQEIMDDEVVWLCNPNNPTGEYIPQKEIQKTAENLPFTTFIIDEAYRPFLHFEDQETINIPNVILLRSLTKLYQLAGVRIGYLIADEKYIQNLKKFQPDWSVNSIAQKLALNVLKNKKIFSETRSYYAAETIRFISELRKIGCKVKNSSVNFFLLETESDENLIGELLKRGIVVRHTRNFAGINGHAVRVAVRSIKENNIFIKAMTEIIR